jgi:hypothetical protein
MNTNIYIYMFLCVSVRVGVRVCASVCVYVCVFMCVCVSEVKTITLILLKVYLTYFFLLTNPKNK